MFNPHATPHALPLHDGHVCLVLDDALLEPARIVELACRYREDFREVGYNAYPGPQLPLPESFSAQLKAEVNVRVVGDLLKPGDKLKYIGREVKRVENGFEIMANVGLIDVLAEELGVKNCKFVATPGVSRTCQE
jgi:hypothetical protein